MDPSRANEQEEELFDNYLDALLRGEEFEPESYMEAHGSGEGALPGWIQSVWDVVHGAPLDEGLGPLEQRTSLPVECVGEFELLRPIGEGGMGRVFLAKQRSLRRLCAVKLLRAGMATSPTASARLEREGRVVAALTHDNIVRVLDAGQMEGQPWVAFELVPGRNLDELLQEGLPPVKDVVGWGIRLADALQHASEQDIIHRDVKPSNVRITPERRALLLDFGLARHMDRESLQLTHDFAGTPSYVAPEQITGESVDQRCDVYGLGATLYEALSGKPPFRGDSLEQVLGSVIRHAPAPLQSVRGSLPRDLVTVVSKALEKDPSQRYRDAAALRDDLLAVQELRPIQARPPGPGLRAWNWMRRHRAAAAMLVTVLAAMLLWASAEGLRRQRERSENRRSAATLVTEAADLVSSYAEGRESFELANYALASANIAASQRYVMPGEVLALDEARRKVNAYAGLKVTLEQVPIMLGRAEKLHAESPQLAHTWASYWFQLWMDVRDDNNRELADRYAARIHAVHPNGPFADQVSGRVALTIQSNPPGAEVYLYYMHTFTEAAGLRYLPVPIAGPAANMELGTWALRIVRRAGELREGDLIVRVAGHPIRDSVLVPLGDDQANLWGRLRSIGGVPINDAWTARRALLDKGNEESVVEWIQADGSLAAGPGKDLRSSALYTPEDLVSRGQVDLEIWRDGDTLQWTSDLGIATRITTIPLPMCGEARVGSTPLAFPASDPGYYVALVKLEGYETARLSFHIDHACEHYSKGLNLHANLLEFGSTPLGYVPIPADSFGTGSKPYWMQEREVTCKEYQVYLDDLVNRQADHVEPAPLPRGFAPDWPMLGLSVDQAQAYAEWRSQQPDLRERNLVASLPNLTEWRWGAFGGDGRKYTYGDSFVPSWIKGRFSRPVPTPEVVGSFPVDESPWSIFDLGGSASEWVRQDAGPGRTATPVLTGGAWNLADAKDFTIARTRYPEAGASDAGAGFRLVLHKRVR